MAAIALRPAADCDLDFLRELYATTRDREMAVVPWTAEQKRAFLAQQFDAQQAHYGLHYDVASHYIVQVDGEDAGRFWVDRSGEDIVVVDLALLPKYRGAGVGSHLVSALFDEARQAGRRIAAHVERWNPALRLWARMGFQVIDEQNVYVRLIWDPAVAG